MAFIFGILLGLGIVFAIAEFWGRTKHIGRTWSILFLLSGIAIGLIVIALSPSAKQPPPKGSKAHFIWGIICIIFGIIILATTFTPVFIVLGVYLIQLSKGKIVNHNPRISNNPTNTGEAGNYYTSDPHYHNTSNPSSGNNGNGYTGGYDGGHNNNGIQNTSTSYQVPPQNQQQYGNNTPQNGSKEFKGGIYNR